MIPSALCYVLQAYNESDESPVSYLANQGRCTEAFTLLPEDAQTFILYEEAVRLRDWFNNHWIPTNGGRSGIRMRVLMVRDAPVLTDNDEAVMYVREQSENS